jgi:hypothetical protein
MNARKLLLAASTAGLTLLASACNDDDEVTAAPATVTRLAAAEIAARTNDGAAPLEINDLLIDDSDTDETSSPLPVN